MKLREPSNELSHLLGAFLGVAALVVLVCLAHSKSWHRSAFAVCGTTVVLLYLPSGRYDSL
jgi:predicted membrane channel-forming protein YqfA (hemolysin III family)